MQEVTNLLGPGLVAFFAILILIQAIFWFFVPFVIFALNKRIKILINHQLAKEGLKISSWSGTLAPIKK